MPLENTFSVSPYFDDFNVDKEFYKVLFKPGVAVQTRELNQLQTIVQEQIERLGNHVFKSGTIVSGVNFSYNPSYSYIKILDAQTDTAPVSPSSYLNLFLKSSLNLTARVVNFKDGFESNNPDLSTLYVQYMRSSDADGNGAIYSAFRSGDELTIYDIDNKLFSVTVNNGGTGFVRNDTVVIQSAITLRDVTGVFTNGETITQSGTGARAVVTAVDTYQGAVLLKLKPVEADLLDPAKDAGAWTMYNDYRVVGGTSGAQGVVASSVGAGAVASLTVDSLGVIDNIVITSQGSGYDVLPHVTVKTANSSATVSALSLTPLNYKAKITVASVANSAGTGYAFSVTEGIIFQKGYFVKVNPQTIVVDKYSSQPNNVVVGFKTAEQIVDVNTDTTLYDNASNTTNFAAPGADRLKLEAILETKTSAEAAANNEYFVLAEWSEGAPYRENRSTVYSTLGEEFARRTQETNGDFVLDPFIVSSKDIDLSSPSVNATSVSLIIDPGLGYISGKRVETKRNAYIELDRSTTSLTRENLSITANYGNYTYVDEYAGSFPFASAGQVSLRDTAANHVSGVNIGSITPPGDEIGTARVRQVLHDTGTIGSASARYRLYLFDIVMTTGKSFRDVRSISYLDSAIADTYLETDPTSSVAVAKLHDTASLATIFRTGLQAVKEISQIRYTFRTQATHKLSQGSATVTVGPLASGFSFPVTGTLSEAARREITVVPIAETKASANMAGNATFSTTTTAVTGYDTSFLSTIRPGDFLYVANSGGANTRVQVAEVLSDTQLVLTANAGAAVTSANMATLFPALHPIGLRDRSVSVTSNTSGAFLTVGLKRTGIDASLTLDTEVNARVDYNINATNASPKTKTVKRNQWVKLHTSNNAGGATGPWSIGVVDPLRLKGVWVSTSATVNTAVDTEITQSCYLDLNSSPGLQRPAQLVLYTPNDNVNTNIYIHVKYDGFESSGGGFFNLQSYKIDDSLTLDNSVNSIHTLEIPEYETEEFYFDGGFNPNYYDLRDSFDFRVIPSDTATITSNNAAATLNPTSTITIPSDPKLLPVPGTTITFDAEYYIPREDRVFVNPDATYSVIRGGGIDVFSNYTQDRQSAILSSPNPGALELARIRVGQYPSVPKVRGTGTIEFLTKRVGVGGVLATDQRARNFSIIVDSTTAVKTQPRRYTMKDINALATRVTNVEKSSALTKLELAIRDKSIPSENDPTVERFKYGYFVEPFDEYTFADTTNKEFRIDVEPALSRARPLTRVLNHKLLFDRGDLTTESAIVNNNTLMLPYTEETLINQQLKTSIVNPDGQRVQFVGEGTIEPYSFEIAARVDMIYTKKPPPPAATRYFIPASVSPSGGGDGGGSTPSSCSSAVSASTCGPGGDGGGEGGGCFTADTMVTMADGTTKRIADIQVGECVLSQDGVTVNTVTFIEVVSDCVWTTLYSPDNDHEPFATINHPLYVDGKLTVYSPNVNDLYPWLNIEHETAPAKMGPRGSKVVYNLWVNNDSTYIVNGYGTTSIIGDGGWLAIAGNRNLYTQDQLQVFFTDWAKQSSLTRHGGFIVNNFKIDNKVVTSFLQNAVNHNGVCRQLLFGLGFMCGAVNKIFNSKGRK